jgi:hypothetical protein
MLWVGGEPAHAAGYGASGSKSRLWDMVCGISLWRHRKLPRRHSRASSPCCGWDPRLEPLLRRPISFYRIVRYNGWVEFIYKLVGKGTEILTGKVPGDTLDLVGPLGQGWTLLPETKKIGVLGRGIGIAPQIGLAEAGQEEGG